MRANKTSTEIRQEQIARAAMKLLATRGWQKVNISAIARQVGVVPSAVYRHFASKDEVLDCVLDLVEKSFQANLQAASSLPLDPIAQMAAVFREHVAVIVSGTPIPRIILSEDVFTGNPRHRKRVHGIYQAYLANIRTLIEDGQKRGMIRLDLKPRALALMWLGLVQSPAILWLLGKGDFDLQQHCATAWQLFESCIRSGASGCESGKID